MKIHATITSTNGKQASRSDNDSLKIEVKGAKRQNILELSIKANGDGYSIEGYAIHHKSTKERPAERFINMEV